MKVLEYTPKEFAQLEPYWRQLEIGKDMTAFQSYDWYCNVNRLYSLEHMKRLFRKWRYLLVLDGETPILIAPISIISVGFSLRRGDKCYGIRRGYYFIGRSGYTDYLNFIYNDFSDEALALVLVYLKTMYKHHQCCFEQMIADTAAYQYLDRHYQSIYLPVQCAALTLPRTFEEYRLSLSKNTRQNIRTALNRTQKKQLELTHSLVFEVNDETKKALLSMRKKRLGKKIKKSNDKASLPGRIYNGASRFINHCFSAKQNIMHEIDNAWYFLVKDGEHIVSFFWGIRNPYKGEMYVIMAGVDEEYAWYSPSISHFYSFLEEYYASGRDDIKVFDFTRGGEKYKKDIGCKSKPVFGLVFSLCRQRTSDKALH